MKKHIRYIIVGAIVLALAAMIVCSATAPLTVPLTRVAARTAELTFTEQGVLSAGKLLSVYPLTQGPLDRIHVTEGQVVREGDILCEIDAGPLLLRMEEIRAVVRGYEAQMRAARVQDASSETVRAERIRQQNTLLEQQGRDLARAQEELARMEILFAEGAVASTVVDAARSLTEGMQASLTASNHELAVLQAKPSSSGLEEYYAALIESSEAVLAQLAREAENCTVRAPASGLVARLPVREANIVSQALPVAEIAVVEDALAEVYVSTQDLASINTGDEVGLILKRREGDIRFSGRISRVDSAAKILLSTLGVEERKVKVEIVPDKTALAAMDLGIGFTVDIRFTLYREEGRIVVPKTALYKDGDKDMLWVLRDGRAREAEVTTGMELRTETVVLTGLSEGDYVVTNANNSSLKDGAKIRNN